jgi:hypothetical protein
MRNSIEASVMVKLLGSGLLVMLVFFGSLGLREMTSKVVGWLEAGVLDRRRLALERPRHQLRLMKPARARLLWSLRLYRSCCATWERACCEFKGYWLRTA